MFRPLTAPRTQDVHGGVGRISIVRGARRRTARIPLLSHCTETHRMTAYQHIQVPAQGQKITVNADFSLNVPDQPIIPFIEGDGTGLDITPVMIKVVDAAVAKAYGGAQDPLDGGLRRREVHPRLRPRRLAARGNLAALRTTWCPSRAR
jgi:hypothetical protein